MEEEFEILQSIFFNEIINIDLKCSKPFIEILIHPTSTDDTQENNKLIKLVMKAYLSLNYPDQIPLFEFPMAAAKGILQEDFLLITKEVEQLANRLVGQPMLFEIIQFIQEKLSSFNNLPKSFICSICIDSFEKPTDAFNLQCYHYFHIPCLSKYLSYVEKEIEEERKEAEQNFLKWKERKVNCPECRLDLTSEELNYLKNHDKKNEAAIAVGNYSEKIVISENLKRMQENLKLVFERQKLAGGIIDRQEIIILTRNERGEETSEGTSEEVSGNNLL